jgi:hypothetical protein
MQGKKGIIVKGDWCLGSRWTFWCDWSYVEASGFVLCDCRFFFEIEKRRAINPSQCTNSDFPTEIVHWSRVTLCNLYYFIPKFSGIAIIYEHFDVIALMLKPPASYCVWGRGCWLRCIENHAVSSGNLFVIGYIRWFCTVFVSLPHNHIRYLEYVYFITSSS